MGFRIIRRGMFGGGGGGVGGVPVLASATYNSSIDGGVTAQPYRYCYLSASTNMPIVILMHGFNGDYTAISDAVLQNVASYGLFAATVGMRGRSGRTGSQDASGREIHDIYDALTAIRTVHAARVNALDAAIVGYSGGGGNVLAALAKFPDTWLCGADHFGIADYGRDATDGWYVQSPGDQPTLRTWIGGSPVAVPDNYYARDAVAAIANYSAGKLFLYHDSEDTAVPVVHSQRVAAAMAAAGRTNYTYSETTPASSPRWTHGYPEAGSEIARTIPTWAAHVAARTTPTWTIPASGTIAVIGYIVTKRFSLWLGTGQSEVATVAYNTATDQYTVTPLTGSVTVTITQGAKTATQTISGVTTITVI